MINHRKFLGTLFAAVASALASAGAADPPMTSAVYMADVGSPALSLAAYRAMSASRSRDYDRAQDISLRQMLILLEVAERTGANLGQALATGEFESAHTWNDHVRPTLSNGNLGSATGVWQFIPSTFHWIIKKYGARLLAAAEEDLESDRPPLDLGEGPFSDAEVRRIIQETADGRRGMEDEELQLLRHNFAVLAFAKHYLSLDSGATSPDEDYLFHFLGAKEGRRVLALARGKARDTLSVKPTEVPFAPLETEPETLAGEGLIGAAETRAILDDLYSVDAEAAAAPPDAPGARPPKSRELGLESKPEVLASGRIQAVIKGDGSPRVLPAVAAKPRAPDVPPRVLSEWGLPADSPTVTGNLGMFYRDGKGRSQPYTWGEFMANLVRRVRAESQPRLVRAKYGVGFHLEGGDLPERAFDAKKTPKPTEFLHEQERKVLVPEALVTGPLSREETRQYKRRLADLVTAGEDKPTDRLPPEALLALRHLRMLPAEVMDTATSNSEVRKALQEFRKMAGKADPDNVAHSDLLMPAERIALEIYDQRLSRYGELQACQLASLNRAPDLNHIRKMLPGSQRWAAPHIAELQRALAAQGLLKQPTKKTVWRDKKRKKRVKYQTLPFAGKVDKATLAALDGFQVRNGLRKTDGVLDQPTLEMLGLPPMGPEILVPPSGPQCALDNEADAAPSCEVFSKPRGIGFADFSPRLPRSFSRILDPMLVSDCRGFLVGEADPEFEPDL